MKNFFKKLFGRLKSYLPFLFIILIGFILNRVLGFILLFLISFFVLFDFFTSKFVNPYKCFMLLGGPGSGKTTYMTKYAYQMARKGWNIFSNVSGVGEHLDPRDLGSSIFPPRSVVMIDEASLSGFDGRDWKNFDKSVNFMIKCHRKNKLIVVFSSQGVTDADKRLRDCMDYYIIVHCVLRVFIIGQKITKRVIAVSAKDSQGHSDICDDYHPQSLFSGGVSITFIPAWYKKFDTNSTDFGNVNSKPGSK